MLEALIAAAEAHGGSPQIDLDRMRTLETKLSALIDRRLATALPLIEYDLKAFGDEARWLAEFAARELPGRYSYTAWIQAPRWPAWMLLHAIGAVACLDRRFEVVDVLWQTQTVYYEREPLAAMRTGGGAELGDALELARFGKRLRLDGFWHLAALLSSSDLIRSHYPELLRGEYDDSLLGALGRLGDFSYLLTALGGRDGVAVLKLWQAEQVSASLPLRLETDSHLRSRLSEGLGIDADDLVTQIRQWVDKCDGPRF